MCSCQNVLIANKSSTTLPFCSASYPSITWACVSQKCKPRIISYGCFWSPNDSSKLVFFDWTSSNTRQKLTLNMIVKPISILRIRQRWAIPKIYYFFEKKLTAKAMGLPLLICHDAWVHDIWLFSWAWINIWFFWSRFFRISDQTRKTAYFRELKTTNIFPAAH